MFYCDQAKALLDQGQAQAALDVLDRASARRCENDYTRSIRARVLKALGR